MEPRCVLPSMRTISVPADCTRSQFGAGRNRYVRLVPGGVTRRRNRMPESPKGPDPYNHIVLFWFVWAGRSRRIAVSGGASVIFESFVCSMQIHPRSNGKPPRRTIRCGGVCGRCPDFGNMTMPRNEVNPAFQPQVIHPARRSVPGTLVLRSDSIGNGPPVCAAFFNDTNPIHIYPQSAGRETLNRQSTHSEYKIARVSEFSTGGGTAVTSPTSRTGGTDLRLFLFPHSLPIQHPLNISLMVAEHRIPFGNLGVGPRNRLLRAPFSDPPTKPTI